MVFKERLNVQYWKKNHIHTQANDQGHTANIFKKGLNDSF